jgi:hypothetical protein
MRHFFLRAEMRKQTDDKPDLIDADYEKAAHLAALVAPYRHARLGAMKLAGDQNCHRRRTARRAYEAAGDSDIGRPY